MKYDHWSHCIIHIQAKELHGYWQRYHFKNHRLTEYDMNQTFRCWLCVSPSYTLSSYSALCMPLVRDRYLLHMASETSSFRFFIVPNAMMFEVTSSRGENVKNVTCNHPGFLSRKKDFCFIHPKWLDCEFRYDTVWMPNEKRSIEFSGFLAVMFSVGEISRGPATQVHPIHKTMLFWVHVQFLWHKSE